MAIATKKITDYRKFDGTLYEVHPKTEAGQVNGLATVATTGSYNDLTNTPTNHVTTDTDQDISGVKTFVGQKRIKFKQSGSSDKLGFTLYTNADVEKGYLEYNPTGINGIPLMTLGNYATTAAGLTHVGFRRYSSISGAAGAYNLLAPLIADAKTPFNLTTTYTNFYLLLGATDGTNIATVANTGLLDISPLLPTLSTVATSGSYNDLTNKPTLETTKNILHPDAVLMTEAVTSGYFICGNASGYKKLVASATFDIDYPILLALDAASANDTLAQAYRTQSNASLSSAGFNTTLTNHKMCYLTGTLSGKTFTVSSAVIEQDVDTNSPAKIYIPLGIANSTNTISFVSCHDLYYAPLGTLMPYPKEGSGGGGSGGDSVTIVTYEPTTSNMASLPNNSLIFYDITNNNA